MAVVFLHQDLLNLDPSGVRVERGTSPKKKDYGVRVGAIALADAGLNFNIVGECCLKAICNLRTAMCQCRERDGIAIGVRNPIENRSKI